MEDKRVKRIRYAEQQEIFNYVNFAGKVITISQKEMQKLKTQGGIKLLNLEVKSMAPKVKWLIEMATNENLKRNLDIFTELMGTQKGGIRGKDIIFLRNEYMKSNLKTDNTFYREALSAMSRFSTLKGINSIADWDKEHIFYNPLFLSKSGKTLKLTKFCEERKIFTFDQLLEQTQFSALSASYEALRNKGGTPHLIGPGKAFSLRKLQFSLS